MRRLRTCLTVGAALGATLLSEAALADEDVGTTQTTTTTTTQPTTTTPEGTVPPTTTTTTQQTTTTEDNTYAEAAARGDQEDSDSWAFSPFWVLGVDGEYIRTIPADDDIGDPDGDGVQEALDGENGAAVHARLGYQLNLTILYLRPEIGGGAYFFGSDDDDTSRTEWRAYGGARFGLRTGISPGIYGHLGYGWYGKDEATEDGFTADAGLLLDLTLIPHLNIGLHGGFVFNPDPVPFWVNGGAHVEVTF